MQLDLKSTRSERTNALSITFYYYVSFLYPIAPFLPSSWRDAHSNPLTMPTLEMSPALPNKYEQMVLGMDINPSSLQIRGLENG